MDPLSIASGAGGLVVTCVQVSATIYTWISDTRQVDASVSALCEEILSLSRVLDTLAKTWKRNPQIASTQTDPDGTLWSSVKASIDDCRVTLEKLSGAMEEIKDGGWVGRGFLRRPTKQVKFHFKKGDIAVYQQRVKSYNSAMQSALHMINLCLLLQSNSSQESVSRTLNDLKSQIGRVEGAILSRDNLLSIDDRQENDRISSNLQRFVRAAESFHSSASTVVGDRSTVWGGSMMGDPLTEYQVSNIENWIPPPGIEEEDDIGENASSTVGSTSAATNTFTNQESTADTDLTSVQQDDSESDEEKELTKHFERLAVQRLEERDYEKAEQFFLKVIDRSTTDDQPAENLTVVRLKLGFTYCFQGKWQEAEEIIVPIATGRQRVDVSAFHGMHTLALLHFGKDDLETAHKYCKRALTGKKKLLGKDSPSYFESIVLLSRIHAAKGEHAESEVYRSLLPPGHINELPASPLDYLYKSMPSKRPQPKDVPILMTPPVETPPIPSPVPQRPISTQYDRPQTPSATANPPSRRPQPEKTQKSWRSRFGIISSSRSADLRPRYPPTQIQSYLEEQLQQPPQPQGSSYGYRSEPIRLQPSPQYYPNPPNPDLLPYHPSPTDLNPSQPGRLGQSPAYSPPAPEQYFPNQDSYYAQPLQPYSPDNDIPPPAPTDYTPLGSDVPPWGVEPPRLTPGHPRTRAELMIGVDFGTTDTSVAWAYVSNTDAKEDIITEWPGAGSYTKPRIPTVLYYDQYQKVVGWGIDIADALAPTGYPKPGIFKVEWFKLQLMLSGNTYVDSINLPPLPPGKSEIDVAVDFLFKVRQAVRDNLRKTLGEVFTRKEREIQWCFTVPAIWNDAGKASLRVAIIQAGFLRDANDNRLTMIAEPEALVQFCAKTGLLGIRVNDAVLVVDAGGGTVDLISYTVEDESPLTLTEATSGTGDSCGSTAINRNFSNILKAKIRKMKLPDGSKTAGRVYAKCIMDFDGRIKHDFRNNGQKWAVDVGIETEFLEADIEEGYMTFNNEEILTCFSPVVDRILELVRNQIIAVQTQDKVLQNILVAGTFGAHEYLFQQIKLHVPPQFRNKVVRPMDSGNAVVKGAVTACMNERLMTHKICRHNYVVDMIQPFQSGRHPEYYCVSWPDGRLRCKYTYQVVRTKGERVKQSEPMKVLIEHFVAPGEPLIFEDRLYECDDDVMPNYVTMVDPKWKERIILTTDITRLCRNPEVDLKKIQTANGTYYLVNYHIYFTLEGSRLSLDSVFAGEVVGKCDIPF